MTWTLWRLFNSRRFPYLMRIPSKFSMPDMPDIRIDSSIVIIIVVILLIGLLTTNTLGYISYSIYFIPIIGTIAGMMISTSVGQRIGVASQNGSFDLLAVTPLGQSGAAWVICLDTYKYHGLLRYLREVAVGLYRIILAMWVFITLAAVLLWLFLILGNSPGYVPRSYVTIWNAVVIIGLISLGLYVDFVQSAVVGCILGMISPTWNKEKDTVRLIVGGIYLLNQMIFYGLSLIIILLSIRLHYSVAWYVVFTIPFFTFLAIYFLRELNIYVLLQLLAARFHTSRHDFLLVMQAQL